MTALFYFSGNWRNSIGDFSGYRKNTVAVGVQQIAGPNFHSSHVDRAAKIKNVSVAV